MSSSETSRLDGAAWLHFVGAGGSGMSALAQFHAAAAATGGGLATGSDRAFDRGERAAIRRRLEEAGVVVLPQDGHTLATGRVPGHPDPRRCDAVIVSTAVENQVPDYAAAVEAGIPVLHRSELLARYVSDHRTIAVSGTSGKSTVTAMIWTILEACGHRPGLLTGGPLAALTAAGLLGNAHAAGPAPDGDRPWLVIEADESDGSLVRYRPWLGVVLNLGLDHKLQDEVMAMFRTFAARTGHKVVVAAEDNLRPLWPGAVLYGPAPDADPPAIDYPVTDIRLAAHGTRFTVGGVPFTLPQPGLHNVKNACAAIAACATAGIALQDMVSPLAGFAGVARRFQSLGTAGGIEVIDDFAHNPDKITAALATARIRPAPARGDPAGRVLAVFQPHGFGPTRFLRGALAAAFSAGLRPEDVLWLPEIYFAGGTVTRDISSADLAADIIPKGVDARFVPDREALPRLIAAEARPGDVVLVMGARDPSLTDLGRAILGELGS